MNTYKFEVGCSYFQFVYGGGRSEIKITKRTAKTVWYCYFGDDPVFRSIVKFEGQTESFGGFKALNKVEK